MKVFISLLFLIINNFSFSQDIEEEIIDTVNLYVKIVKYDDTPRVARIDGISKYKNKEIMVYHGGYDGLWVPYSISVGLTIYREVYIIKQKYKGKTEIFGRTKYTDFLVPAE